jgi:fructose-bisphosphate aldolase class I
MQGATRLMITARLNAMNVLGDAPWELSFSYGRTLQAEPLRIWAGEESNARAAQAAFAHRAFCNGEARRGRCSAELERQFAAA